MKRRIHVDHDVLRQLLRDADLEPEPNPTTADRWLADLRALVDSMERVAAAPAADVPPDHPADRSGAALREDRSDPRIDGDALLEGVPRKSGRRIEVPSK